MYDNKVVILMSRSEMVAVFGHTGNILAVTLDNHDSVIDPVVCPETKMEFAIMRGEQPKQYAIWTESKNHNRVCKMMGRII